MKNKLIILITIVLSGCRPSLNDWLKGPKSYGIIENVEKIPNSNMSRYTYYNDNSNGSSFFDVESNKYQIGDTVPYKILENLRCN